MSKLKEKGSIVYGLINNKKIENYLSFAVSFREFKKDPTKAALFLALGAIVYLYIDNRAVHKEQRAYFEQQLLQRESRIQQLEQKVDELYQMLEDTP